MFFSFKILSLQNKSAETASNDNQFSEEKQKIIRFNNEKYFKRLQNNTSMSTMREKTRVIIFIPSPVSFADRRTFVYQRFLREGWKRSEAIMFFVFGSRTGERLEYEIDVTPVYGEGIEFFISNCRDFGDEFNNPNGTSATTCKVYEAIKYIYRNFEAEFVWRGADDAYLNLKVFFSLIPELPNSRMWLGRQRPLKNIRKRSDTMLKHQPKLQKLFGIEQFPPYMMGIGYAFSWDVVQHIASWHIPPHQTWCEDVMVGMWLNPFQINRIDRPDLLRNRDHLTGSRQKLLLIHYMHSKDWENIDDEGKLSVFEYDELIYEPLL